MISVKAAGVNFPDLLMTEGKYQHMPVLPYIPGMECAGEIIETRSARFAIGDRVFAGMKSGAFAEETVIDAGVAPDGGVPWASVGSGPWRGSPSSSASRSRPAGSGRSGAGSAGDRQVLAPATPELIRVAR